MELWTSKKIFLMGGPGGVGKTTLAAALGTQLAIAGFKTIVLTVDPAKRLAQALGFNQFSDEIQKVTVPDHPEAKLYATMLDAQRYFDKLIERFALRPDQREKILQNPIYRNMVNHLGGTQEYTAMERLLEFAQSEDYEKIVVDTPPSQNAVDLITAPRRLADFMDNSVLRWFQKKQPYYLKIFRHGTRLAMKGLTVVFGSEFLDAFSELMDDFDGMQAGFQNRHQKVLALLQSQSTAFFLVSIPTQERFLESEAFIKTLQENKIHLAGLFLNQIEPSCATPPDEFKDVATYCNGLAHIQKPWIDRFRTLPIAFQRQIPELAKSLLDVQSLTSVGQFLVK